MRRKKGEKERERNDRGLQVALKSDGRAWQVFMFQNVGAMLMHDNVSYVSIIRGVCLTFHVSFLYLESFTPDALRALDFNSSLSKRQK